MKSMQLPKMSSLKPKAVFSTNTADFDCPTPLKQNFNPSAPNQVWGSDIIYIRSANQFYYLCIVIDLFARKVIFYQVSFKMNVQLTINIFKAYGITVGNRPDCFFILTAATNVLLKNSADCLIVTMLYNPSLPKAIHMTMR